MCYFQLENDFLEMIEDEEDDRRAYRPALQDESGVRRRESQPSEGGAAVACNI